MLRRVVVTGMGAVSAAAWGLEGTLEALRAGRSSIGPIRRFDAARHRTGIAAEVPSPPAEVKRRIPEWRRLSLADRYAVVAAREAIDRAGIAPFPAERAGLFFGTSTGGMLECERFYGRLIEPGRRAPLALLRSQEANGPGDAVARHLGLGGPVESISSACASGALALRAALWAIRSGEVDVALAGGSDSFCELTHAGFNSLRSVDAAACRPFRASRAGLTIGEGAAVLLLESEEGARARGARLIAELAGAGASCDAHHMTAPHPEGREAANAMRSALADAGLSPDDVGLINAHATATPHNDTAEWGAIEATFGPRAPEIPVVATKSLLGHLLGAAGAIEALAAVDGIVSRLAHPSPEAGGVDPAIPVDLVIGTARALAAAPVALSTSLAFGGSNAAVVFRAVRDRGAA
jgi:3-oxoacyl-[acyl-carrier-protein] synthase II